MQYGLYNPTTGIIPYQEDEDFSNEEDGFRIIPTRVFAR